MEAGEEGHIVVAGRPWLRYDPAQLCPCSITSCCPQMVSVGLPLKISKVIPFLSHDRKRMEKYHDILGEPEPHAIEPICAVREDFLASKARS